MKKSVLFSAIGVLSALSSLAFAQEVGRVLSSTPVVQQIAVPRQICSTAQYVQPPSSGGGALVGAIVGGLLGNTIGHGMGRAAATGVGVVAGAAVGDSIENRGPAQAVQNCTTQTSYENRTVGYNVAYEYAGRQYNAQMPYDPGPTIQLQITPMSGPAPSTNTGVPLVQQGETQPSGVVVAPPLGQQAVQPQYVQPQYVQPQYVQPAVGQPIGQVIAVQPQVVYPAYPAYPAYYQRPYYYPPVGISLGLGYSRHRHHWR